MTKEYSVKELAVILIRKWILIVNIGILVAIVSMPLSTMSYEAALDNYNNILKNVIIPGEEEAKEFNSLGLDTVVIEMVSYDSKKISPEIVAQFLSSEHSIVNIFNLMKSEYNYEDVKLDTNQKKYQYFKSNIMFKLMEDTNKIEINLYNANRGTLSKHMDKINDMTEKRIKNLLGEKVSFKEVGNEFTLLTKDSKKENIKLAEVVMKEPTLNQSRVKILGTSMIFGMFLTCTAILFVTFGKQEEQRTR